MSEEMWRERAQSAEATIVTIKESSAAAIGRIRDFKANFGIREKNSGEIDINFDKFAENLGLESALELRGVIDLRYSISGGAGEKPRIKLQA